MAETDQVQITAGSGTAIEADDLSEAGSGPFRQRMTVADMAASLRALLQMLSPIAMAVENGSGRVRIVIDSSSGAQTLGTVGTVSTVNQDSGWNRNPAWSFDGMMTAWQDGVRSRVT